MDNAETPKEWYVTHNGQQFGPVSLDDLKFEAERGELNPRLDMVWKNGMEDWIPAGDVEGLFEKNKDADEEEKSKATPESTPYVAEENKEAKKKKMALEGKWGGSSRSAYLFVTFIMPILWGLGIGFGAAFLSGKVDQNILGLATSILMFVPLILVIYVTINRFTNLAMSRWWFFGLFVPFLNLWINYRTIACPAGYAEHKRMDVVGWILAILYWLVILISIAAIAGFAYIVMQNPQEFQSLETPEEVIEHLRKNYGLK